MKALVGAFNQEKALVGAFSVIVQPVMEPMYRFTALVQDLGVAAPAGERQAGPGGALRPRRHVRGQEAVLHLAADREDGQGEEGGCWCAT